MARGRRELPRVGDGDRDLDPGSFPFPYMGLGSRPGWTGEEQALGAARGSQQPDGDGNPLPRGTHGRSGGLGCC